MSLHLLMLVSMLPRPVVCFRRDYYVENGDKDGRSPRKDEVRIFMNVVTLFLRTTAFEGMEVAFTWLYSFRLFTFQNSEVNLSTVLPSYVSYHVTMKIICV